MGFIAPMHEDAKWPRGECNKCNASQVYIHVHDIFLYPVGTTTMDAHRTLHAVSAVC